MKPWRHTALVLLTLVYAVNFIDRQILSIVMPQIRTEFHVSDTMLGLLAGPMFALFYSLVGVPVALLADRVGRKRVIVASLACFSCVTFAAGLVARFWQLLLARTLTGIGEAGTGPAAQSIIADLYRGRQRVTAQALYATGVNLGIMVAFFFGGWIAQSWGWRATFMAAGIPGIVLSAIIALMLREPVVERVAQPKADRPRVSFLTVTRQLWRSRAYRWIACGAAMTCFTGYGTVAFFPSFLARSHHLQPASIGLAMALTVGLGGAIVTSSSGWITDQLNARDIRWSVWVPMLAVAIAVLPAPVAYLTADPTVAIGAAVLPLASSVVFIGPIVALTQRFVQPEMRATAVSLLILTDNLVGLGVGPQFVGTLSDWLRPGFGEDSLRWALLTGTGGYVISAICFWRAARYVRRDLVDAE
jgi:predicted MFS family arabinose efflux permease